MEFVFENNKKSNGIGDSERKLPESDNFNQSFNMFDSAQPVAQKSTRRAARRSVVTSASDVEFNDTPRPRKRARGPKVNYVKPIKKTRRTIGANKFEWSWTKLCWAMCALLVLRLVFVENGIIDYYSMKETLIKKEYNLQLLRQENVGIMGEIHKIRTSPKYQKKIARDHLGVIARGEYLVLFSSDRAKY